MSDEEDDEEEDEDEDEDEDVGSGVSIVGGVDDDWVGLGLGVGFSCVNGG